MILGISVKNEENITLWSSSEVTEGGVYIHVWFTDQAWGHDGWILAKFSYVCLWTETEPRPTHEQKKIMANI